MLTQNNPACIRILFDDHRLVPMPACSCRSPSPGTSACGHSSTICDNTRKEHATTAIPAPVAITRCSRPPPARARC